MSNKTSDKNVVTEDVNELKRLLYSDNLTQYGKRKLVSYYDKRIQELEEERDHWHGCFIVAMENSIAKEKVKDILQNNRNELFSMTYLSKEQYKPYEMQVERINKIEQELLEGERK